MTATNVLAVAVYVAIAVALVAGVIASSLTTAEVEQASPGRCAASPDAARPGSTPQNSNRSGVRSTGPANSH